MQSQAYIKFRHTHQIKRNGRSIKNPFKGIVNERNGSKYRIEMNEDGQPIEVMIPEIPNIDDLQLNEKRTISIDVRDEKNLPRIFEKMSKKFEKRTGVPTEIIVEEKTVTKRPEPQSYTLYDANNKLVLGFVKILFETACEFVDGYVDSNMARQYAKMLLSGKIDYNLKELIELPQNVNAAIVNEVKDICVKYENEHIAVVSGFQGIGLVGFVKIFNMTYTMVLNNELQFSNKSSFTIVYNDFKKNTSEAYKAGTVPHAKINIGITRTVCLDLLNQEFIDFHDDIKLYDSSGNLKFNSAFDIVNEFKIPRINIGDYRPEFKTLHLVKGQLFINSKYHGKFIPVGSIVLEHVMKKLSPINSL